MKDKDKEKIKCDNLVSDILSLKIYRVIKQKLNNNLKNTLIWWYLIPLYKCVFAYIDILCRCRSPPYQSFIQKTIDRSEQYERK